MNPLLYSSNEMFSSTELIRKSKMIFDKLLSSEIEKAIILRDGKPGFMLLDFEKYEELMKEYISLKEQIESQEEVSSSIENTISEPVLLEEEKVDEPIINEEIVEVKEVVEEVAAESSEEQFEHIEDDISEDDLKKALEDIENMSFAKEEESKKEVDLEEFDFQDDFTNVVKEKKEQPLKEFWDD